MEKTKTKKQLKKPLMSGKGFIPIEEAIKEADKIKNKEYKEIEEPLHLIVVEEGKNLELLKMLEKKFGKNAKMEDIVNYYRNKFNISGKVILY